MLLVAAGTNCCDSSVAVTCGHNDCRDNCLRSQPFSCTTGNIHLHGNHVAVGERDARLAKLHRVDRHVDRGTGERPRSDRVDDGRLRGAGATVRGRGPATAHVRSGDRAAAVPQRADPAARRSRQDRSGRARRQPVRSPGDVRRTDPGRSRQAGRSRARPRRQRAQAVPQGSDAATRCRPSATSSRSCAANLAACPE